MTVDDGRPYRPSWWLRQANTMLTRALCNGRGPRFMRLLSVDGRRTGTPQTTPVVPVLEADRVWLVAPFGDVDWVRNIRIAGRARLRRGDDHDTYEVREVEPHEAVAVLRRYLSTPARFFVRRHLPITAKSSDDAIAAAAAHHPVFELIPAS